MGILKRFKKGTDRDLKKHDGLQKPQTPPSKDQVDKVEKKIQKPAVKKADVLAMKGAVSDVIVRPLVTEKSAVLASNNMYVFVIDRAANKIQVRSAIKEM